MTKLIALDDGHGMETAGKRTPVLPELGRAVKENEFNRAVVRLLDIELKRCGFRTLLTAPTDVDTPLSVRTNLANNARADLFMSIHFNAFDALFNGNDPDGFSAHVQIGYRNSEAGRFAQLAVNQLAQGTQQRNRGVVEQDLHVTRETAMPAVLFELGFMDNPREARFLLDVGFQKECAVELAKAVCQFFGVAYVSEQGNQPAPIVPTQGLGVATVVFEELPLRKSPEQPEVLRMLKRDEKYIVFNIRDGWYDLGNSWVYGDTGGVTYKDRAPKYRVKENDVVAGEYRDWNHVIHRASDAVNAGKKVLIERV